MIPDDPYTGLDETTRRLAASCVQRFVFEICPLLGIPWEFALAMERDVARVVRGALWVGGRRR
jgi:hypothetical protein